MGEATPSDNLDQTMKGFEGQYQHLELGLEMNRQLRMVLALQKKKKRSYHAGCFLDTTLYFESCCTDIFKSNTFIEGWLVKPFWADG